MTAPDQSDDPVLTVLRRADALAGMGRPAEVLDLVTRSLGENPGDTRLLVYATWSCLQLSHVPEAVSFAEEALEAGPDLPGVYLVASRAYLTAEDGRRALAAVERGLQLDPDSAGLHNQHAFVRITGGPGVVDKDLARRELERALELEPDDPERLLLVAQGRYVLRDLEKSRELVARGLALAPEHSELLLLQVQLTDADEDAAHLLTGVLANDPQHAEAGYLLQARIWTVLRTPANSAAMALALTLYAGGWLWSDLRASALTGAGIVLVLFFATMAHRAWQVTRSVPQAVLRRSVRDGGWWARVGRVLSWASLLVSFGVVLGFAVIRAEAPTGTLVVVASGALLLSGSASALLVVAAARAARLQGVYPPGAAGTLTVLGEWRHLRSGIVKRMVVLLAVGLVTAALSGWAARPDALWAVLWAVTTWTVPSVARMWICAAELRRRLPRPQPRSLWLAPVALSVVLLVCGGVGLVSGPLAGTEPVDDDGVYGTRDRAPSPRPTFDPSMVPTVTLDPSMIPTVTLDPSLLDSLDPGDG